MNKVEDYREFAEQCLALAQSTRDALVREHYLILAAEWDKLAAEWRKLLKERGTP